MQLTRRNPAIYLLTLICALLVACESLGLPSPETTNERIAAAQGSVTQIRVTAAQLLTQKRISIADAENALRSTDAASEGIAVVRTMAAQDPAAAQARLTMIITGLTAINAYLASRQP